MDDQDTPAQRRIARSAGSRVITRRDVGRRSGCNAHDADDDDWLDDEPEDEVEASPHAR